MQTEPFLARAASGNLPLGSRVEPYGKLVSGDFSETANAYALHALTSKIRVARSGVESPASFPKWKRALDLMIILLSSPFWLPLMILIMAMIKITSAGPIFYRQERIGYRGRRFMLYKFRTMKVNAPTCAHESHLARLIATDSPMTKLDAQDSRLIKGGSFLRAAGLDELPQVFNIWRGEMSLVGARPCTPHEFERYQPWQRERVNVPPGLTGPWQVSGKNKTTFSEMVAMDVAYAREMSLSFDLSILWRTLPAIVSKSRR